jgi:CRP-like cAMP-binding protein
LALDSQLIPVRGTAPPSSSTKTLSRYLTGVGAAKSLLQHRLAALGDLSSEDLAVLDRILSQRKAMPQRAVLSKGGEGLCPPRFLLSGWACQQIILQDGQRQILVFLVPGDILAPEPHLLGTIVALTPVVTANFSGESPEPSILRRALAAAKDSRERLMRQQVLRLGGMNAVGRTAHMLLEFSERLREVGLSDGHSISLPISQETLSDALGMTAVHVNRTLTQFRENGAIAYSSRHLLRIDPVKLARAVNYGRA